MKEEVFGKSRLCLISYTKKSLKYKTSAISFSHFLYRQSSYSLLNMIFFD